MATVTEIGTDAQERLAEDGFVMIREAVSKERLSELDRELRAEYDRQVEHGSLFEGGGRISGHLNCFPGEQARFVVDDLRSSGVLDLLRDVAPDAVDRMRANCNINLPGSSAQ